MENGNFGVFIILFIKFRTKRISEITILWKILNAGLHFLSIFVFDFMEILHSQVKSLFKCKFFFHLIISCCRCAPFFKINSKTSQVDQNQGLFPVYLCFLQKSRTFQGLVYYFSNSRTFPIFKDAWEPCHPA